MTTFAGKIPLFNGENYTVWKTQMEAVLHKNRLLQYVLGKVQRPAENEAAILEESINKDIDARCEIIIAIKSLKVNLIKKFKVIIKNLEVSGRNV